MNAAPSSACGGGAPAFAVPNDFFLIFGTAQSPTIVSNKSGNGDSITAGSPNILTDAGAAFDAGDVNSFLSIAGATTPANNTVPPASPVNGTGWISSNPGATQVGYANISAVTEAYSGAWTIPGRIQQITDVYNSRVFAQNTTPANRPNTVPFAAGSVLGFSGNQSLEYVNAGVVGQYVGVDVSVSFRIAASSAPGRIIHIFNSSSTSNFLRFGFGGAAANLSWGASGLSTNLLSPSVTISATFRTLGYKLVRASNLVRFYVDGVFVDQSAPGTSRNPVGLDSIFVGTTSGGGQGYIAAMAGYHGAWSDAEFLAVHNQFMSFPIP